MMLVTWYKRIAVIIVGGIASLLLLNLAVSVVQSVMSLPNAAQENVYASVPAPNIQGLYPDAGPDDLKEKLWMNGRQGIAYTPYTETKNEPGYNGKYLIHDEGFRIYPNLNMSWPPSPQSINIFVFGGGAILGPNLADQSTIPFIIQKLVAAEAKGRDVQVYNFATYGHLSTQQRLYFESLLVKGHTPDIVLFYGMMEDLAQPDGAPFLTDLIAKQFRNQAILWQKLPFTFYLSEAIRKTALYKLLFNGGAYSDTRLTEAVMAPQTRLSETQLSAVVKRYLENIRAIESAARSINAKSIFIQIPLPPKSAMNDSEVGKAFKEIQRDMPENSKVINCDGRVRFPGPKKTHGVETTIQMYFNSDGHLRARASYEIALCTFEAIKAAYPTLFDIEN